MLQIRDFTQSATDYVEYVKVSKSLKYCKEDDILIGRYGASVGKILTGLAGAYNVAIIKSIPNEDIIIKKYIKSYFLSPRFQLNLGKVSLHRAAQAGFSKEDIADFVIPVPPAQEQEKIVAELDCLTGIIEKKKQQLKELDNLAQSIFYDMFGDPIANDKGWEMCKVGDCMKVIGGYAFKSSSYSKSGYRLVQIANVWKDELVWDEITYISFNDKQVSSSFILKEGDVLMAMTRPVIKSLSAVKIAIVRKEDTPCILNQRVCKFVSDGRLSIIWFYNFARTEYFKDNIVGFGSKGMQPNVSAREIESIKMYLPPRSLQDLYAKKIDAIEKQKELVKRSIVETETLFNSRMDYWFN